MARLICDVVTESVLTSKTKLFMFAFVGGDNFAFEWDSDKTVLLRVFVLDEGLWIIDYEYLMWMLL